MVFRARRKQRTQACKPIPCVYLAIDCAKLQVAEPVARETVDNIPALCSSIIWRSIRKAGIRKKDQNMYTLAMIIHYLAYNILIFTKIILVLLSDIKTSFN